jgi:ribose transport system ATP-binding protein
MPSSGKCCKYLGGAEERVPLLEMIDIRKEFPGVQALDKANLAVEAGECHALVGENGAGKSTLMRILSGVYTPDTGVIRLDGVARRVDSPIVARRLGITMIHQEFNLVPEMTVAENIFLGHEIMKGRFGWLGRKSMEVKAEELLESFGQKISGRTLVKAIGFAQQQMVEIAKAISVKSRVLVMDEPSAILTDHELAELFDLIGRLKRQGVTVIYISHRLEEIFENCDRITVMRDGRTIHTTRATAVTQEEIIRLMVGREIEQFSPPAHSAPGREILRLESIVKKGKVHDINLVLRQGEIVGLTGLVGAGRTELAHLIFGADLPDSGRILLEGQPVVFRSPREAIDKGIGLLTEDRKSQGLVLNLTVRENVTLANLKSLVSNGFLKIHAEKVSTHTYIGQLAIKAYSTEQMVRNLSGGTQQKVVLSKWLFTQSKVLIFDEPTRGIDVGAKAEIYQLMWRLSAKGIALLMISSELPEILKMCDRILVMHEGEITGELKRDEANQEKIMRLAMGLRQPAGAG